MRRTPGWSALCRRTCSSRGVSVAAPEGWSRSTDGSSASRPRRSVPSRRRGSRESLRRKASWRSGRDGGMAASRAAAVTADGAGAREVSGWRGAESIDAPATGIESRRRRRGRVEVGVRSDDDRRVVAGLGDGRRRGGGGGRRLLEEDGGDRTLRLGRAGGPAAPGLVALHRGSARGGKVARGRPAS